MIVPIAPDCGMFIERKRKGLTLSASVLSSMSHFPCQNAYILDQTVTAALVFQDDCTVR